MKKFFLAAALAMGAVPFAPAAAASVEIAPVSMIAYDYAQFGYGTQIQDVNLQRRDHDRRRYANRARYDRQGRYIEPRRLGRNDRVWRGRDGRYHCRRENGTTGLIIGAAAGALLGREIDGGRDRTLGTIIGAAGGGLLGREIDRGELRCR